MWRRLKMTKKLEAKPQLAYEEVSSTIQVQSRPRKNTHNHCDLILKSFLFKGKYKVKKSRLYFMVIAASMIKIPCKIAKRIFHYAQKHYNIIRINCITVSFLDIIIGY